MTDDKPNDVAKKVGKFMFDNQAIIAVYFVAIVFMFVAAVFF